MSEQRELMETELLREQLAKTNAEYGRACVKWRRTQVALLQEQALNRIASRWLADKTATIESQKTDIVKLNSTVSEQAEQVAALKAQLQSHPLSAELNALNDQNNERGMRLVRAEELLGQRAREVKELQGRLASALGEASWARRRVAELEATLAEVEAEVEADSPVVVQDGERLFGNYPSRRRLMRAAA
jgi:predicted  nucleic acid-binding Zn-ribbon protein